MKNLNVGTSWLVEERDHLTGDVKFYETYSDYNEALTSYNDRKRANMANTVSIQKCEKSLLLE
jgi:hypothetical protein